MYCLGPMSTLLTHYQARCEVSSYLPVRVYINVGECLICSLRCGLEYAFAIDGQPSTTLLFSGLRVYI